MAQNPNADAGRLVPDAVAAAAAPEQLKDALRPVISTLARVMVSDRRAVALLGPGADVLLLNQSARRLGIAQDSLVSKLDWPALCRKARLASRVAVEWRAGGQGFEGELIHLPMDPVETFYLRLSDSEHEALWLRNRARAASLMRVAHDLRTPIQALLASSQGILDRERAAHLDPESLRRAAEVSLDQINTILATIRGESRVKGVRPDDTIRIGAELRDLVAMLAPVAANRSTTITLAIDAPGDLALRGPLQHLRALFQNLLDNSVNHGGGKVAVALKCRPLDPGLGDPGLVDPGPGDPVEWWSVVLEILDEGGGMPPLQRARLAQALEGQTGQVPAQPRLRQSAGLEVLAHALHQLGGKLEVLDCGTDNLPVRDDAERVIGTLFRASFSLPRAMPEAAPAGPAAAPARGDGPRLAHKTLLLVEDSPSARDWLSHVLQAAGAEVLTAGSGPEALSLLSREEKAAQIDLILSDVTLPHMSGIELCARIRRGDPASALVWTGPIVGLTAHADDAVRAAALQAGMTLVLEKPILPDVLVQRLAGVFGGAAQTLAAAEVIDQDALQRLTGQMGAAASRGFMLRALAEAQMVVAELLKDGIVPDTGRRLHAATGACGLTGLHLVESRLRAVEKAVEQAPDTLPGLLPPLQAALAETRRLTEALPE